VKKLLTIGLLFATMGATALLTAEESSSSFSAASIDLDRPGAPWAVTATNYESLNASEQQLYLDAYLETSYFILYGMVPPGDAEKEQMLSAMAECARQTHSSDKWNVELVWRSGELLDKSAAHAYYEAVTSVVCKPFLKSPASNDSEPPQFYTVDDWRSFSARQQAIYLAGYLDTAGAFAERMAAQGSTDVPIALWPLLETMSVDQVLTFVNKQELDDRWALPRSIASGVVTAVTIQ